MNDKFKVGDVVVYVDTYPQDTVIVRGDVGVVKLVREENVMWPYYVDFGKGGITMDESLLGLAPMDYKEIVSLEEWNNSRRA